MNWLTEAITLIWATCYGVYLCYPSAIGKDYEDLTPTEESFLTTVSGVYKGLAVTLVLLDTVTAVLLLISMKRIYNIIKTQYTD